MHIPPTMHIPPALALLFSAPTWAALPYRGVDWSSTLQVERSGTTYKNSAGQVQPLETILQKAGVNAVRQRIWVDPAGGDYDLNYNIALGKRAKAAGLAVYLNFHYSDNWADPGKQAKPAAWSSLSTDQLVAKIYEYTKNCVDEFARNGVPLAMVSIGNEIRNGMLYPTGQFSQTDGVRNTARLLKSASKAVKESSMSPKPKIMLHVDNGWNQGQQTGWYDKVLASGGGLTPSDYDIQGVSYYPFYNTDATLARLESSLNAISNKYQKEIMVVETDWPTSCPNPSRAFPADVRNIPFSVDGQKTWMKAVAAKVAGVSGGRGTGLFYWEPAWVGNGPLGSSCAYNLMFASDGKAMDSLSVFASL